MGKMWKSVIVPSAGWVWGKVLGPAKSVADQTDYIFLPVLDVRARPCLP